MNESDSESVIEQSQEVLAAPHRVDKRELSRVHDLAEPLLHELEHVPDGDLVAEVIENALKLLRDKTNRGDIKLIDKSFKELRYSLRVFAPYRDTRKVSIFGSARTPENDIDYLQAAEFGKKMVAQGWMVMTGAGGGIMAAGHGGAGAEPSFGLAIRLPFEQATNAHIAGDPKLINFKYFFTRKLMFVRSSSAVVCFPGGFGTMDEGFEVLTLVQTGKSVPMPIVFVEAKGRNFWAAWQEYVKTQLLAHRLISEEDLHLYKITNSVDEAVKEVTKFYSNYHSVRNVRDDFVMRLHRAPSAKQLDEIKDRFGSLVNGSPFRNSGPLPVERDEAALAHMPRLIFGFNRKDHGKLRQLIDYLNEI